MNPPGVLNGCRLLTEDEVAGQLGCSVALLRKWRRVGGGPPFCRIGRLVRYSEADIAAYIDACRKGREG